MAQIFQPLTAGSSAPGSTYALNPGYTTSPSVGRFQATPEQSYYSQNPTEMASAWDLPPNAGTLQLPSGADPKPADQKALGTVKDSVSMLTIYGALASGKKLTAAELAAAQKLGPDVARAAQLAGTPKGAKAAITAQKELTQRLETTVGIDPNSLTTEKGLNGVVSKNFATTMQNAGYGVTSQMTYKQALNAAAGGQQPLPTISGGQTVSQYLQNLSQLSSGDIKSLQSALWNGGFFDSEYYTGNDTSAPKGYVNGQLDAGTKLAMRKALLQTLQDNQQGKKVTLEQVIGGGNPVLGTVNSGDPNATSPDALNPTGAITAPVIQATSAQTQSPLEAAFENALGRAPTQQELQAFTSTYDQAQIQGSKAVAKAGLSSSPFTDQNQIPTIPGVASVSSAATAYAQNTNPDEYQGHNIAGAFGMLMQLIDRPTTNALDTPGARPAAGGQGT